jgi:zinc transport system ATP-binding protein
MPLTRPQAMRERPAAGNAPPPGPPLVEARGLTVRAGGRALIRDVNLAIHAGEIVTVIGPNGAGKTTLVRALLGVMPPSSGTVVRRPELRIGYLPQRIHVEPTLPLTVRRFLTLARGAGTTGVQATLDEVGAAHLERRLLSDLSGGEFQRVLMARALIRDPALLILDEPVQGVDVAGQIELYELIENIRRRHGCGVLLVSHDLHLVMRATDRVLCLNGHICCAGQPESVVHDPAYLELFGSRAARSLAVYAHAPGHDHRHNPVPAEDPEPGAGPDRPPGAALP